MQKLDSIKSEQLTRTFEVLVADKKILIVKAILFKRPALYEHDGRVQVSR